MGFFHDNELEVGYRNMLKPRAPQMQTAKISEAVAPHERPLRQRLPVAYAGIARAMSYRCSGHTDIYGIHCVGHRKHGGMAE
jgi:hypothetical protein